jgi:serine/threonine protein phosphatase PrpC
VFSSFFLVFHIIQAYNLSRDHKPELEAERERIQGAGGYIQMGRVNGTLNLSRAIGMLSFLLAFFSYLACHDRLHMQARF